MENPKCPYCGATMALHLNKGFYSYYCPSCYAEAPAANSVASAYAAAMKSDRAKGERMTNADYIRKMDDERLFHLLDAWNLGDIDYAKNFCDLCEKAAKERGESTDCDGCLKWWLKQDSKMPYFGLEYWAFSPWNERSLLDE